MPLTPLFNMPVKFFQQVFLLASQLDGGLDRDLAHQVTDRATADRFHTLAAHAEHFAGLRLGWNLEIHTTVQGRHFQFAAQCGRDETDRDITEEIAFLALKDRVLLDRDLHIEIARRTATLPGLALTGQADTVTVYPKDGGMKVELSERGAGENPVKPPFEAQLDNFIQCMAGGGEGGDSIKRGKGAGRGPSEHRLSTILVAYLHLMALIFFR